ncbi:MAG: hypothetical protein L0271_17190 [Gemmatimonadetes bacterium]|nr:hypothetical protein [Gemmatimonadota bacterium]
MADNDNTGTKLSQALWTATGDTGSAESLWLDLAHTAEIVTRRPTGAELADVLNEDPDAGQWTTKLGITIAWILAMDTSDPAIRRVVDDVSQLVLRLSPSLLDGVLRAEPEPLRRLDFLEHCTTRLTLPAAFRVAAGLASMTGRPLSKPLEGLLKRMAQRAAALPPGQRPDAEEPIRATLSDLVVDLIARPVQVVSSGFEPITHRLRTRQIGRIAPEPERIIDVAIESEALGDAVFAAVDELTRDGVGPVIDKIKAAPANAATAAIMKKIATPQELNRLLAAEPIDESALDLLVEGLGLAAARVMLETLAESRARATRRYVLDRLASFGAAIQPLAEGRLKDSRWFVQRNMIALLRAAGCKPAVPTIEKLLGHADPRIRREAMLWALEFPATKELAIGAGLQDNHPDVLRPALNAARSRMPQAAVPVLARRLISPDFPPGSRVLAIGLLGRSGSALARDALMKFVISGKTFLGKPKLAPRSPEMLAALSALARTWRADKVAAGLLAQAKKSRDPEIAAATYTGSVEMS